MQNSLLTGLLNRIERPMFWHDLRPVHDSVATALLVFGNSAAELMTAIRSGGDKPLAEAIYNTINSDFEQSVQEIESIFALWSAKSGRISNEQEYADQAKIFDMYRIAGERHQALFTPNLLELTDMATDVVVAKDIAKADAATENVNPVI